MSGALVVGVADGSRDGVDFDAVLASLPVSFVEGSLPGVDVRVIDGAGPWPAQAAAAAAQGVRAVIVVHPEPADVNVLQALDAVVVLVSRWASNPAATAAGGVFAVALPQSDRVECSSFVPVGTRLESALLDQLALLRTVLGPVTQLDVLARSVSGVAAEGESGGHPVDLSVVCTDAVPSATRVRLLTADGSVELDVPDDETARPARLSVTGPAGETAFPTLYESGRRASWRRAHRLLDSPSSTTPDLAGFAADLRTVRSALPFDED